MPCGLGRPCDQSDPIKVGYHPAKFGDHRYSTGSNILVLVFHMILQDHMIKGSYDFIGRSL